MRAIENIEKMVIIKELKEIVCNSCGKSFKPSYSNSTQQINLNFQEGSKYECSWAFDICEECLIKIIKNFKIVPDNFMKNSSYISSFETDHDLHQKLFEEWKETGKWNEDKNPYKELYNNKD